MDQSSLTRVTKVGAGTDKPSRYERNFLALLSCVTLLRFFSTRGAVLQVDLQSLLLCRDTSAHTYRVWWE